MQLQLQTLSTETLSEPLQAAAFFKYTQNKPVSQKIYLSNA